MDLRNMNKKQEAGLRSWRNFLYPQKEKKQYLSTSKF